MYKIEFTLKQHTPLIHFQHDQDGATLRATEVKPKLDRFIDYYFEYDFDKLKQYLISYNALHDSEFKKSYNAGRISFDYKIEVKTDSSQIKISGIPDKFPCFFGNMGDSDENMIKKFSFSEHPIKIIFKSNHKILIDVIISEFPNFLARNNFGNRQSKGFGSFYIDETDPYYQKPHLLSFFSINWNPDDHRYLFKDIELIHKVLRSGINDIGFGGICKFYMKPLIWQFFYNKKINWDKRAIKKHFYPYELTNQSNSHCDSQNDLVDSLDWPICYNGENYKLVKDLLGLSSTEKWRIPYNVNISKSSGSIDRFKSPIFYKPIKIGKKLRIYIDAEFIPEDFYEASFSISNGSKSFSLITPKAEEFEISDFLTWCFTEVDILNCIPEVYQGSETGDKINDIFLQFNNNLKI